MPATTPRDVVRLLGDTIARVRKGTLEPRLANAVGYLASVALRAIEVGELAERLERVEAAVTAGARAPTTTPWDDEDEDDDGDEHPVLGHGPRFDTDGEAA